MDRTKNCAQPRGNAMVNLARHQVRLPRNRVVGAQVIAKR